MDNCPVLAGLCKYTINFFNAFYAPLTMVIISATVGILFMWVPRKLIDIQLALYKPFNWKVEPVSMEKGIRNVRLMGFALFMLALASFALITLR